jgi:hypothetical protein
MPNPMLAAALLPKPTALDTFGIKSENEATVSRLTEAKALTATSPLTPIPSIRKASNRSVGSRLRQMRWRLREPRPLAKVPGLIWNL